MSIYDDYSEDDVNAYLDWLENDFEKCENMSLKNLRNIRMISRSIEAGNTRHYVNVDTLNYVDLD